MILPPSRQPEHLVADVPGAADGRLRDLEEVGRKANEEQRRNRPDQT